MIKKRYALFFVPLLATALATAEPVTPQPAAPTVTPAAAPAETPKPQGRLWNLQDADIISVINEISLETGKNFAIDPRVTGKITLVSSKPIKPDEVYDVFLSVLAILGYSAIPTGNVVKIVPNMESSEYATRIATSKSNNPSDEVVVRIIPLENATASQIIPVLRPLLPQWSNITAYTPGNIIILAGRAGNLERLANIINNIDKTSDASIEIVHLRQASASQMTNVLSNLQTAARASGDTSQLTFAADERSNSILLSGNKAARIRARALISQLDTPSSGAQGNTEVIYLRYLQAKNFAPILGKIAQNLLGKDKDASSGIAPIATNQIGNSSGGTAPKSKEPENLTNIQAEPTTNSLIITAPPAMMRALNAIVAKLDIRPAQVLVEGILVEINQDDLKNFGIQWGTLVNEGTTQPGQGFQQFGQGTYGVIPAQQIQAVLAMLQTNRNVNILSTPSVVVLDNQKALLDIGQDVPTESGSYATTGSSSTVNPFNTIAYKKVALVLEVTPQINLGNSVRLNVKIKNDTLQNPDNPGLTPLINTSQISNSVIVNSCDILVLGGLIRNSVIDATDKVPFLGDIPAVGALFRHKTRKLEKRNLIIFLKPVILHNAEESTAITHSKYELTRNSQINWPVDLSNPGAQKTENILPLWKNDVKLPKPFEAN